MSGPVHSRLAQLFNTDVGGECPDQAEGQCIYWRTLTADGWYDLTAAQWYTLMLDGQFTPSKAALFIRTGGSASGTAFNFTDTVCFDSRNFFDYTNSTLFMVADDDGTGGGSLLITDAAADTNLFSTSECPTMTYNLVSDDGAYFVWIRVKSQSTSVNFDVILNGLQILSESYTVTAGAWTWVSFPLVITSQEQQVLTIRPSIAGVKYDKIVVTNSTTAITGTGPDYDDSPYVTAIVSLYNASDGVPAAAINTFDAKNTAKELIIDDWYNFRLDQLDGNQNALSGSFGVVLAVSGGSQGHFITWDYANTDAIFTSATYDGTSWTPDEQRTYALMLYSSANPLSQNCGISGALANAGQMNVTNFDPNNSIFANTKLQEEYNGSIGEVVLDLPNRIVTYVIDQSGSMTWNDPNNTRTLIAQRMANRLSGAYPSDIKYNVLAYRSTPVTCVFFASETDLGDQNVQAINSNFFANTTQAIAGVRLIRKAGSEPTSHIDGVYWDGIFSAYKDTGLDQNTEYFYKVYTYDQYGNFSNGIGISATPMLQQKVRGITYATSLVIEGTGIEVDSDVIGLWHMNESSLTPYLYDFSQSGSHFTLDDTVRRLTEGDVPIGNGGVRLDNGTSAVSTAQNNNGTTTNITVMAWIYPFNDSGVIISRQNLSEVNYMLRLFSGQIVFQFGNKTWTTNSYTMPVGWFHVAFVANATSNTGVLYVNGTPISVTTTGGAPTVTSTSDMTVNLGRDIQHDYPQFFGKITEVSVHATLRSMSYIQLAAQPNYNQGQDNGDRIVVLNYIVPTGTTGNVIIVSNINHVPSHPEDGTVILDKMITENNGFFVHSNTFNVGKCYYTFFVQDETGHYSLLQDCAQLTVTVPTPDTNGLKLDPLDPPLEPVNSLTSTPGDGKIFLQWKMPTDDTRVASVKVFYSTDTYPVVDGDLFTGTLIFVGDTTSNSYLHSNQIDGPIDLIDGQPVFYTVVTLNKFDQISSLVTTTATPEFGIIDPTIPLPEVSGIYTESYDSTSIIVGWNNTFSLSSNITGYFDDTIYIYANLLDVYGNPITTLDNVQISATVSSAASGVPNVFMQNASTLDLTDSFDLTTTYSSEGIIRSLLSFDGQGDSLANVNSVQFSLTFNATKPDTTSGLDLNGQYNNNIFSYTSYPITVTLMNPLNIQITNTNSDMVPVLDGVSTTYTDGCYIRRNNPFQVTIEALYRGQLIDNITMDVAIKENHKNSVSVTLPDYEYSMDTTSLVLSLPVPQQPTDVIFFATTQFNGFYYVADLPITFANILQISVNASAPIGNGIDYREQFSQCSIINPNIPSDVTPLPDGTVVNWSMTGPDRPFYSTDNVNLPNGVYSFVEGGTARHVYLGPISEVVGSESYNVTANVVYDGLSATQTETVYTNAIDPATAFIGNFLLSEVVGKDIIWADGRDYVKVVISHDWSTSDTLNANLFREWSAISDNPLIVLPSGQLVTVTVTDTWQIVWGDNVYEETDPYTGESVLNVGNSADIATGSASFPLSSGEYTTFYVRVNSAADTNTNIIVDTVVNFNGILTPIRGGIYPNNNGLEPVTSSASTKEPLQLFYVDQRANGEPSDVIIVDGSSINTLIFQASFAGSNLPSGQTLSVDITKDITHSVNLIDTVGSIKNRIDPFLNPEGPALSFASIRLGPLVPINTGFLSSLTVTCSYDALGTVKRNISVVVTIQYDVNSQAISNGSAVFESQLYKYNVGTGAFSTLSPMNNPRGALCVEYANNSIYAIGGIDGRTISIANEKYESGSWSEVADMITPRYYSMSVTYNNKIYVIGGITQDKLKRELIVIPSLEEYDTISNTWTELAPMPTVNANTPTEQVYGVAMGTAQYYNGNIYVFSGFIETIDNSTVSKWNDRVLIYNIAGNSWTYTTPFVDEELTLYTRLSPYSFINSSSIVVGGGVYYSEGNPVYVTDSFSFSTVSKTIMSNDYSFDNMPEFRYKSAYTQIGTNVYIMGGSNYRSLTLRTAEKLSTLSVPISYTKLSDLPKGLNATAACSDGTNLYIVGGISGGRDPNFLQIKTDVTNSNLRLDGKQSLTVDIDLADDNGVAPDNVDIILTAYPLINGGPDRTKPVLISDTNVSVTNGTANVVLLPRSYDSFTDVKPLAISSDDSSSKYSIILETTIMDTVHHGETRLSVKESQPILSNTAPVIGQFAVTVPASSDDSNIARGVFINSYQSASPFDLTPPMFLQNDCLTVNTFCDIDSIPTVDVLIGNNSGEASDVVALMKQLSNEIPFGASPMYDALYQASDELFNDLADLQKNVYLLCDGNNSASSYPLSETILQLQSVALPPRLGVVPINLAIGDQVTQAARFLRADYDNLQQIASQNGGESVTFVSENQMDDLINEVVGTFAGTLGYGIFQYTVDLGEVAAISSLTCKFHLYENSFASWKFSISDDNVTYSAVSEPFLPNAEAIFTDLTGRYISFIVTLNSGLSEYSSQAQESQAPAPSPSLYQIDINFTQSTSLYLYLNNIPLPNDTHEYVVTINMDAPRNTAVQMGLTTDYVASWQRMSSGSQPLTGQSGKIVIPWRKKLGVTTDTGLDPLSSSSSVDEIVSVSADTDETLDYVDGYLFRTRYGKWDANAAITVYSSSGSIVSSDEYLAYPDQGAVVFSEKQQGPFNVSLDTRNNVRIGLCVTNYSTTERINIRGVGYMYTRTPYDDSLV